MPPARRNIGLPPYDPMALSGSRGLDSPEQIVDFFARRLLAVPLTPQRRAKLVSFLSGEKGNFSAANRSDVNRVRTLIHLLMSTPEYQLY